MRAHEQAVLPHLNRLRREKRINADEQCWYLDLVEQSAGKASLRLSNRVLGALWEVDQRTVTYRLGRLVERGLVRRVRCGAHEWQISLRGGALLGDGDRKADPSADRIFVLK